MKNNKQVTLFRQTYVFDKRQAESFVKDTSKLFAFNSTIIPFNEKVSKIICENDLSDIAIQKEQKQINNKLNELNEQVESLRQLLRHFQQSHEYLGKIQSQSQKTYEKLQGFKIKMATAYQNLAAEEQNLIEQLQLWDKKVEAIVNNEQMIPIAKNQAKAHVAKQLVQKKQPMKQIPQNKAQQQILLNKMKEKQFQCSSIEQQIHKLGKGLGWPQEDHSDFVSLWSRNSNKTYFEMQADFSAYFVFYTGEQIRDHMNKYIKLNSLLEKKKQCIYQYKLIKQQKKQYQYENIRQEQKKMCIQQQQTEAKKKKQEEQANMKVQLQLWKIQKAKKQKEEERQQIKIQNQKRYEQEQKRQQLIQKNKIMLQQWKQFKEQSQNQSVNTKIQIKIDPQTQLRIKQRQQNLMLKKVSILEAKKRQKQFQNKKEQELKEKLQIKYAYVNTKVEESTKAVKDKQRKKFDGTNPKDANTFGGNLLGNGIRATPMWMKDI